MPSPSNPSASLLGAWQLVRAELQGEAAPELVVTKTELTFATDAYEVRFAGEIVDRGTFEVRDGTPVAMIILHGSEGPNRGRTIPCIYQMVGDRMRICYGLAGVTPTEFTAAAGEERYLAIYRRKAL